MGFRVSWLGIHGLRHHDSALSTLKFRRAGEFDEVPDFEYSAVTIGEWLIVFANRFDYANRTSCDSLSAVTEIVSCSVNETTGMSSARGFAKGKLIWSLLHDGEKGHLTASGELPSIFCEIRARAAEKDRTDQNVDWFFDVPVEVAEGLTGFRHDGFRPGDGFECLEPLTPDWQLTSEIEGEIELPTNGDFASVLATLDPRKNSFFVLTGANGNYIQCGGSTIECTVEFRIFEKVSTQYTHYVVGKSGGSTKSAWVKMSEGGIGVQEGEILTASEAAELFGLFISGTKFPEKYSVRVKDI